MGRRTWIKIYTDKWLRGSIRKEQVMVRSIFIDLLALAGDSAYGDSGLIQLAEGVGFTDETIACMLNVPLYDWQKAKDTLSNHKDKEENRIKICELGHGFSIEIINWHKYQSEYSRQKPIRNRIKPAKVTKKVTGQVTPKVTQKVRGDIDIDRERDIEGDIDKEKNITKSNGSKPISTWKQKVNRGVQEVIDYAHSKNFGLQGTIKANRFAASNLIKKKVDGEPMGVERVKKLIDLAVACRGERYAPQVNDFVQLSKKWLDLMAFGEKKLGGGQIG